MKQFYSLCMIMLLASVLAIDVMGQKTTLTVTGKVTDLEGDPLSGVSVVVQGTTRGTITNIDGAYSINVPSKQSVLVFSMISMKTVDHRVGNSTQINIIMEEDVIGLGDVEVVAIGYGSMRRSDLTGSISSISKDALSERAITSLEDAMRRQPVCRLCRMTVLPVLITPSVFVVHRPLMLQVPRFLLSTV